MEGGALLNNLWGCPSPSSRLLRVYTPGPLSIVEHFFVFLFGWVFNLFLNQFSLVQWLSRVRLFTTLWTAACQASLSITNSQSLLKLMSIESVMPSNHPILCRPLILLPSIFPSIRVFSNESALCIRWPKYWSFSYSISSSKEYSGLTAFRIDWFDLLAIFQYICEYVYEGIW